MKGMSLEITEDLIARQTPEAQAIIRALLAKIQQSPGVAVDFFGSGGRADQQRQRARPTACGHLAEAVLWHAERRWKPLC